MNADIEKDLTEAIKKGKEILSEISINEFEPSGFIKWGEATGTFLENCFGSGKREKFLEYLNKRQFVNISREDRFVFVKKKIAKSIEYLEAILESYKAGTLKEKVSTEQNLEKSDAKIEELQEEIRQIKRGFQKKNFAFIFIIFLLIIGGIGILISKIPFTVMDNYWKNIIDIGVSIKIPILILFAIAYWLISLLIKPIAKKWFPDLPVGKRIIETNYGNVFFQVLGNIVNIISMFQYLNN